MADDRYEERRQQIERRVPNPGGRQRFTEQVMS